MSAMNWARSTSNLLIVFAAVMPDRVTCGGERMGLSQLARSHAR
jgi:hypothetical protein